MTENIIYQKMILDAGLTSYNELNRVATDREKWRKYGKIRTNLRVEYRIYIWVGRIIFKLLFSPKRTDDTAVK